MEICIATITRGDPRIEFVGSRHVLLTDPRVKQAAMKPGLYTDHGRTELALQFLSDPSWGDWLLSIDDDQSFTPADLDALEAAVTTTGSRCVGGIYWSPSHDDGARWDEVFPIVFQRVPGARGTVWQDTFVYKNMPIGWVKDQTAPFPCDAIGTGFLLTHRSVFEDLQRLRPKPHPLPFYENGILDDVACGEDLIFCHRVRTDLHETIYAVPCPTLHHVKLMSIPPQGAIAEGKS